MKNSRLDDKAVFVGAARTAVGSYLGELKTVPVEDLGVIALNGAIERSGIDKTDIDEVITGHVTGTQTTNNLSKIIGINAGLKKEHTAMTVNRICGSGIQSAVSATQSLILGDADYIAAGGAESLSRAPFYLPESVRYEPLKSGNYDLIDANIAGHNSASGNHHIEHMGNTAENVVKKFNISREDQDRFALDSNRKAVAAQESGRLAKEIVPVEVKGRKGKVTIVDTDGDPRPNTSMESLAKLRPAFEKGGSVTAGNASSLNDGAAFEIMTVASIAKEKGLDILGEVVDYAITGVEPELMGLGPVQAIKDVLANNELTLDDLDILEVNEAFAGQTLGVFHELGISMDSDFYKNKFDINGGAVALGHPLGMSGARIITTILYEFQEHPEYEYAIASACIGGGQGIAMLIRNGHHQG